MFAKYHVAMSLPTKIEALLPEFQKALRPLTISPEDRERLEMGIDLVSVFGPGPDRTGADRVEAAERIIDRLPYIVHSRKLGIIRSALGDAAPGCDKLRHNALQRIFEAIQELAHCHPSDPENLSRLAAALSRLIAQDLLGPEWEHRYGPRERTVKRDGREDIRQLPTEVPLSAVDDLEISLPANGYETVGRRNRVPVLAETREIKSKLDAAKERLPRARLTKREQEFVDALFNCEGCVKEAAALLGIRETTASVHLHNIRKKIAAEV